MVRPFKASNLRREAKETLARWMLRRRREGAALALPSEDEATHAWDGRRRYVEDYTFAAVQPELGVVVRLEWLPGRDAARTWVWVLQPGRVRGAVQLSRAHESDRWRAGGLRLDCDTPHRIWDVHYVGALSSESESPCETRVDLRFEADRTPFSPGVQDDPELLARHLSAATWDSELLRTVRRAQARGYVQTGRLSGVLRLGDELMPLDASCLRQHRWGVLDWAGSDRAFHVFTTGPEASCTWVHWAEFPFVTLAGGFFGPALDPATSWQDRRVAPLMSVERKDTYALQVAHGGGSGVLTLEPRGTAIFAVDGRGELSLTLGERSDATGWGLWASQRRLLARP